MELQEEHVSILVTWHAVVLEILVNQSTGKPSRTSRGACLSILETWHAVVLVSQPVDREALRNFKTSMSINSGDLACRSFREILVNQWSRKPSGTPRGACPSILVTWHAVVLEKSIS